MKRKKYVVMALGAALALWIGTAFAQQPVRPTVNFAARGTVGRLDAEHQRVEVERRNSLADHAVVGLTFPPGSSSGWHTHPGVVLVTVVSGRLQLIDAHCEREVYEAGETFVEDGHVALARNRGTEDTVVYATWIMPKRAELLTIPADQPKGCNVE